MHRSHDNVEEPGGEPQPPLAEVEPPGPPSHPERPRLKRYYNE